MNRALASRLLVGVLALEIVVPAVSLATTSTPRHYAWSMFVESSTDYRYVGLTGDEAQVPLDPAEVGRPWSAIHYGPQTPQRLCALHPELTSVTRFYDADLESVQPCG
ncbi:hypothetical protein LWC33_04730 [Pseudonocardia sp. RS11V-5]|uniref:hypothetical protein n=1 Tax=Pseudonocardia terrae TaxID=2905831 RepID=UPI001E37B73D|nr:hypothetical protein [Pseudonocardia terrae]MCE3550759.1 hypothetical protein [Pseudonocardia terrae]